MPTLLNPQLWKHMRMQVRRGLKTAQPWARSYPGFKAPIGGGGGASGGGSLLCPKCHAPVTLVPLTNAAMLSTEVSAGGIEP